MKLRIAITLLCVYLAWGSTYLAIRFGVETIPPFTLAATRFLLAGIVLFAWRRISGDPQPTRIHWRSASIIGTFLLLGGIGLVTWAETRVTSGITALVVASAPLWMVLLDAIRPGGQHPNGFVWSGILVGLLGIAVLVGSTQFSSGQVKLDPTGLAVLLLASFLWAIGSLYSRKAILPASPLLSTAMEMLAGSAGLYLAATLSGEWSRLNLAAISPRSLWGLGYLIVVGSLVGFVAYTWLLRNAPTPLVSTYAFVNPLVAVFVGSLFAGEAFTPNIGLVSGMVVSAVLLINIGRAKESLLAQKKLIFSPSTGDD